jgi:small subunit ribosomal protein S7
MRGKRAKRKSQPRDRKYNSPIVARLISKVMQDGKRTLAEKMVYTAIEEGAAKVKIQPDQFIDAAIGNVKPALEIRARRVGGANYQVPVPVSPIRQETLAVRWIVDIARGKSGASFDKILMDELIGAFKNESDAVKKKIDTERMAEANKAFAHFRW